MKAFVNNSSVGGLIGFPGVDVYVASKQAVLGLTKSDALEYAAKSICVNAVSPGGIETPIFERFTGGSGSEAYHQISALHPIGCTGRPEEIAETAVWLCSDEASLVTGQTLPLAALVNLWLARGVRINEMNPPLPAGSTKMEAVRVDSSEWILSSTNNQPSTEYESDY